MQMHETRTLIIKTGRNSFKAENNLKKIYIYMYKLFGIKTIAGGVTFVTVMRHSVHDIIKINHYNITQHYAVVQYTVVGVAV
jgi:hypothetical protein